jgi:thiol:disulfide interchange protein DsbC
MKQYSLKTQSAKRMVPAILCLVFTAVFCLLTIDRGYAFQNIKQGKECLSCHTLTKDEALKLLKADAYNADITDIKMSPIKGLWEIKGTIGEGEGKRRFMVYVDFTKKYIVEGRITLFSDMDKQSAAPQELQKVNTAQIPLDEAVIMGSPNAPKKIIIFDDPDCPYCRRLHTEVKKILEQRKDIVFYIKLFPLVSIHPEAYDKSRAIVCEKSVNLLDDAFEGKKLPKPWEGLLSGLRGKKNCGIKEIDANLKLGQTLGIAGTPAIILPDGRLVPGYMDASALLKLLEEKPQ